MARAVATAKGAVGSGEHDEPPPHSLAQDECGEEDDERSDRPGEPPRPEPPLEE